MYYLALFSGSGYSYFETAACNVLIGFTTFWAPFIRAIFGTLVSGGFILSVILGNRTDQNEICKSKKQGSLFFPNI